VLCKLDLVRHMIMLIGGSCYFCRKDVDLERLDSALYCYSAVFHSY
jgi:hypothetical protein